MSERRFASLLQYLPLASVVVGIIVTATAAQVQIGTNKENIALNKAAVEKRVPTFLYDVNTKRADRARVELAEAVDENEDRIQELLRGNDNTNAKLELEIERLRSELSRTSAEQKVQLENILKLLEQLRNSN